MIKMKSYRPKRYVPLWVEKALDSTLYFIKTRDTCYLELFKASLLLAFGMIFFNPSTEIFTYFHSISGNIFFSPIAEVVWGFLMLVFGGLQWTAVVKDLVVMRLICSLFNVIYWTIILVLILTLPSLSPSTLLFLLLFTLVICYSLIISAKLWYRVKRVQKGKLDEEDRYG